MWLYRNYIYIKQTLQQQNNIFDYCVGLIISSVASSSLADCSSSLSLLLLFVFSLVSCVTSCSTMYVVLIEQHDEERDWERDLHDDMVLTPLAIRFRHSLSKISTVGRSKLQNRI
jgi:hypothetical protein